MSARPKAPLRKADDDLLGFIGMMNGDVAALRRFAQHAANGFDDFALGIDNDEFRMLVRDVAGNTKRLVNFLDGWIARGSA